MCGEWRGTGGCARQCWQRDIRGLYDQVCIYIHVASFPCIFLATPALFHVSSFVPCVGVGKAECLRYQEEFEWSSGVSASFTCVLYM